MVQVSLSTTTTFDGDLNALVEDLGTALTVRFDLDEPAPAGGLKVYVDSEVEQIINRLDLPGFAASSTTENIDFTSFVTNFDNSGFALTIEAGATFGTFTINVFDNPEPDTFLPETFDGRVEAALSLRTQDEVDVVDQSDITELGEYTVDPGAASSTVIFADEASQLTDTPEPPTPEPPTSDGLQVSLFTGPGYLIEDEGTVSAHAFLATNGVIPEGGLVVSVDAPNLSEFDLESVSVEGGEIVAVRDGGFDLRMTEYTTLVNLAVADDGEAETGETASFSVSAGNGYEIIEDYSSGTFNLVDTEADIPREVITEPNDIIFEAVDTRISSENPTFSGSSDFYFDIGNRYLKEDGTYQYIDYSEDVDVYKLELNAGDTIAIETFEDARNPAAFSFGLGVGSQIYDADGNQLRDYFLGGTQVVAAPDKLFGGIDAFDENETGSYSEFTASQDGTYYVAVGIDGVLNNTGTVFLPPFYDPLTPGFGQGNRAVFGNYDIEIDLLTEENPRKTGTPTPPVSNPNVTNPPTLSLSANPATVDSEGNFTRAVVESVEVNGVSSVTFTIEAEGEIPEGGIEFVLNSDTNLFNYVSFRSQSELPSTIGGQSLGAFYNEDGIPTGIRLRIEEPIMTVNYQSANDPEGLLEIYGNILGTFEPLETDGSEDVTFFLQPGEGYETAPDAGETVVTYYDSLEDVPPPTRGGDTIPEVGITVSESTLIESEGTETTLTFTLSEPPPVEGVTVFLDSDDNPTVGSALGQFAVLEAEIEGGNFPISNGDSSGFFFTITEQIATITLPVFDELTVPGFTPDSFVEGILALDFALQPQAGYTIDPNASDISVRILDNPDSQIQVSLSGSTEADENSTNLIETEGTVSVHTFSLSAPPTEEGLTVTVNAPNLDDFDLDAIDVQGGTIAEVRDGGFDLTITERKAVISLPVLEDGTSEGSETVTFTLEPNDTYEINLAATEATFTIADTLDQLQVAEEIEGNSTLPEANVLGLSPDSASVSISGALNESFLDFPEDVDFYSFNLDAGQTVSLDIDTEAGLPSETITSSARPVVFPALEGMLQQPDTELRLFDADGNELAANNDGAAPNEAFSRDPFIEYTAESAGTYYVGVSQLGNRNYAPFVFRDGSGWTFPEVGVFFGEYALTATLTEGDTPPPTGDLTGTDAADTLVGTDGDDLLDGLQGDDIYTGGAGADQFVLGLAQGVDTITDFEVGVDQIKLGGLTPSGVKFFELSDDTLVLTNSNELIGVVQGVTGLDSVFV